ncbi:Armadillo/beta-catenin/plakoglobin [Leucosporidium creatinivorum]|uniref:uracil phosphoribosyltransferase n=1 Tax=Leucosporidium creatinivorum TaxID=106004 RepID=A0A1Y2FYI9_9BASI|nr:Armadillo/beta-catenin/plakoglobin [Leucosporidium creatinivorum]
MSTPYSLVQHPLVAAKLTQLRDATTSPKDFRQLVKELTTIIGLEATRTLALKDVPGLQSPIAPFTGQAIAHRIGISPILRAGIGMAEPMLDLFPSASVFYLGLFREKVSLQPVEYYQKLPAVPTVDTLYILDPLVATGGTAIAAVSMLLDWGLKIENIKLLVLLGSKPGLEKVAAECPGLEIFVGGVDEQLTEQGMIVPGLGDSGDRQFPDGM